MLVLSRIVNQATLYRAFCGNMTSRKEELKKEVPDIVVDPSTNRKYVKGKFLGKVLKVCLDVKLSHVYGISYCIT